MQKGFDIFIWMMFSYIQYIWLGDTIFFDNVCFSRLRRIGALIGCGEDHPDFFRRYPEMSDKIALWVLRIRDQQRCVPSCLPQHKMGIIVRDFRRALVGIEIVNKVVDGHNTRIEWKQRHIKIGVMDYDGPRYVWVSVVRLAAPSLTLCCALDSSCDERSGQAIASVCR